MNCRTNDVGDMVCEHGTALDVHCCNCHSGFLFDAESCVCEAPPKRDALLSALDAWADEEARQAKMWMYQANHISAVLAAARGGSGAPDEPKGTGTIPTERDERAADHRDGGVAAGAVSTGALRALIEQWRESAAVEERSNAQYAAALDQCADQLEAALVPREAAPQQEPT